MTEAKAAMFRNRLAKVFRHVSKLARRQQVSCYRIYDHDLPEFPFCIERYGDWLYIAEYKRQHGMEEAAHEEWLGECLALISGVTGVPADATRLRTRERKASRLDQYGKLGAEQEEERVEEGGLGFLINLTDYLDTGLFLDHRITRGLVREEARGAKMLNLFCYTGSFSVYAAAGGAAEVVSMDLSRTYLAWAARNMALNGFADAERYRFVAADVKQELPRLAGAGFDLVVMDPPTFSNSKRMRDFLDIQRDHVVLINQALAAMRPGGTLYFSTNLRSFALDAPGIRAAAIRDITRLTTPFDFAGRLERFCFQIKA